MGSMNQWPMFIWAGAVALAVVAGGLTAAAGRPPRATVPFVHVAGATLVGFFGWLALTHLPGTIMGYWTLTAGLGEVGGIEAQQLYVVGQIVFVVAAALAIAGILRRAQWGAVLGIGLALAQLIWHLAILYETWSLYGDSMGDGTYLDLALTLIGAQAGPALAAVVLLAWPFVRRGEGPQVVA